MHAIMELRRLGRRIFLSLIAVGLVLALMMLGGFADRMVLYPSTQPEDAMGAARVEVPFGGGRLEIWTARSRGARKREPERYVLSFEGNASRAEWMVTSDALQWKDRPVEQWTVNYPGYGGSTGPARLALLPHAALAAYGELAKRAAGRPILASGTSLGTSLALYVATERPVAGLILKNPPPLQNLIVSHYGWWSLWLPAWLVARQVPIEMNSLRNAPRVRVPAVFVLSELDEVVPPKYQKKVVDAYAGEKRILSLKGATHNALMSEARQKEFEADLAWLWERLTPSVAADPSGSKSKEE